LQPSVNIRYHAVSLEFIGPDDGHKKINDQNHSNEAHNDFPHGQNLPQAPAKLRQRPKKTTATTI
jgi:hypothetical protein